MLLSPTNSRAKNVSIQISEIPIGAEQPVHSHAPEQCYYIVRGKGLMRLDVETAEVNPGDAIHIPAGSRHGIRNIGDTVLEYLTANSPAFGGEYENSLWPAEPSGKYKG
jgi:mannose-6-phosphate isomerase-like protein (cupin superfamily)